MVKLSAPMFSLDARGKLAQAIAYCKKGATNYARRLPAKFIIPFTSWTIQMSVCDSANIGWHSIGGKNRLLWTAWAAANQPAWSGWNSYFHFFSQAYHQGQPPPIRPPE